MSDQHAKNGRAPRRAEGTDPSAAGHTSLLNPRGSVPTAHRLLPMASSAAAWLTVALVVGIVGSLLIEGLPRLDLDFVRRDTRGDARGAYFNGGVAIELPLERAPNAPTDSSGETILATLLLRGKKGEPVVAGDLAFRSAQDEPASLSLRWADGRVEEISRDAASISFGPAAASSIGFQPSFDRDGSGAPLSAKLVGHNLPADLAAITARFLVHRPLELAEPERGALPIAANPESGWSLPKGASISMRWTARAGVMPMIYGTILTTLLMTLICVPFGVLSAVYLHEYARRDAFATRIIRGAINNLAGVPSIVFGLFGLGFFIAFLGSSVDNVLFGGERVYGQPCVLWASCTLAVLTLPVVIVATEEALRAVPQGLRSASLALGATRWQTVWRVAVPQAAPGILTGMILAVGRGAGEVAPILFTGATNLRAGLPSWWGNEKFMHLGYHVYTLATQSPDVERARGALYATVVVLLALTFALNFFAIALRSRLSERARGR